MVKQFAKGLGLAFGLALILVACARFSYKNYAWDWDQNLLVSEKEDLPLTVCRGDAQVKYKCIVMRTDEFFKLRRDFADVVTRLNACEKSR